MGCVGSDRIGSVLTEKADRDWDWDWKCEGTGSSFRPSNRSRGCSSPWTICVNNIIYDATLFGSLAGTPARPFIALGFLYIFFFVLSAIYNTILGASAPWPFLFGSDSLPYLFTLRCSVPFLSSSVVSLLRLVSVCLLCPRECVCVRFNLDCQSRKVRKDVCLWPGTGTRMGIRVRVRVRQQKNGGRMGTRRTVSDLSRRLHVL